MRNLLKNSAESEKAIERYLSIQCTRRGWLCIKYSGNLQNVGGFPDRVIVRPGGRVAWVEVKSTGQKPRPLQLTRHAQLRAFGHVVYVVDSKTAVDAVINTIAAL